MIEGDDIDPQNMKFNIVFRLLIKIWNEYMIFMMKMKKKMKKKNGIREFEKAMMRKKTAKWKRKLEKLKKGDKVKGKNGQMY